MEFKDYYKILGVDRKADPKAITQAFRRLAREYHPDVNKASGAEAKFKEVNEAYQVLSDPQKRARYDQMYEAYQHGGVNWDQVFQGQPWQQPGGFTVTFGNAEDLEDLLGGGGFSDFFRQFFGAEPPPQGRQRRARGRRAATREDLFQGTERAPAEAEAELELTLEEVFRGEHKPVTLQVNGPKRLDVRIPKGVKAGQRIRLPGALDGADLFLTVKVRPHHVFERRGDDIIIELPVTLPEAALGAEVEVPTLEGAVSMRIPPETQSGRTLRLRGLGMPRPNGGRGDQLVRIKIVLPEKLTEEERKFFERMRAQRRENPRAHLGVKK
jgi:curved DNA-binding protein